MKKVLFFIAAIGTLSGQLYGAQQALQVLHTLSARPALTAAGVGLAAHVVGYVAQKRADREAWSVQAEAPRGARGEAAQQPTQKFNHEKLRQEMLAYKSRFLGNLLLAGAGNYALIAHLKTRGKLGPITGTNALRAWFGLLAGAGWANWWNGVHHSARTREQFRTWDADNNNAYQQFFEPFDEPMGRAQADLFGEGQEAFSVQASRFAKRASRDHGNRTFMYRNATGWKWFSGAMAAAGAETALFSLMYLLCV